MNSIQVPATIDDGRTKWATITDREQIEKLPIENNNKTFLPS